MDQRCRGSSRLTASAVTLRPICALPLVGLLQLEAPRGNANSGLEGLLDIAQRLEYSDV